MRKRAYLKGLAKIIAGKHEGFTWMLLETLQTKH